MSEQSLSKWLAQFEEYDRPLAKKLVSSLTIVPTSEVRTKLFGLLDKIRIDSDQPIACFAVRRVSRGKYFSESKDYRTKRPKPVRGEDDGVGSEAVIANIITNYARGHTTVLDHPSFDQMAKKRCRHLIMVDDIVGSGKTARNFLHAFKSHKTIKSWLSGKRINFHYVAYAMSFKGEHAIQQFTRPLVELHFAERPTIGRNLWTRGEFEEMAALCKSYAKRTRNRWMKEHALGYGNEFATMVFEHSCPNNTPSLLWHSYGDIWTALFPQRAVLSSDEIPTVQQRLSSRPLTEQSSYLLPRTGNWIDSDSNAGEEAILLLVGVSKSLRREERLAEFVGVDLRTCKQLIKCCIDDGFLTSEVRLTTAGLAEVRHARRLPVHPDWTPQLQRDRFYFPRILRGARANA